MRQSIQGSTEHQHYWKRHCGDKKQYSSQERAFNDSIGETKRLGKTMEEYECWSCRKWHIGTASLSRAQQAS